MTYTIRGRMRELKENIQSRYDFLGYNDATITQWQLQLSTLKEVVEAVEAIREKTIDESCKARAGFSRVPFEIAIEKLTLILGEKAEGV